MYQQLHSPKPITLCPCLVYNHSNSLSLIQVRVLQGIPALVELFSSENRAVQRYATGATRNLIYENAENKVSLVDTGGIMRLVSILSEPDEELRKTITGNNGLHKGFLDSCYVWRQWMFNTILLDHRGSAMFSSCCLKNILGAGVLWNLSSRDNLKEKLSKEALSVLTEKVLVPLCNSIPLSPSERDIYYNTTGCLRWPYTQCASLLTPRGSSRANIFISLNCK